MPPGADLGCSAFRSFRAEPTEMGLELTETSEGKGVPRAFVSHRPMEAGRELVRPTWVKAPADLTLSHEKELRQGVRTSPAWSRGGLPAGSGVEVGSWAGLGEGGCVQSGAAGAARASGPEGLISLGA